MKMKRKMMLLGAIGCLAVFVIWTVLVKTVDVQAIGPWGSEVGFATLNSAFHAHTGVHFALYHITDWLGLVPFFVAAGFALQGLLQWIKRKSLLRVDGSLLILGGFYAGVIAVYLLFEELVINFRPVLIDGFLEASYPSSTTVLVLCVMPTAMLQLQKRLQNRVIRRCILSTVAVFSAFMVVGRLLSGVHWLTDILGGGLFGAGMVLGYRSLTK